MNKIFKILSLLWMGLIFFASSMTGSQVRQLPNISDVIAHGFIYMVLGGLLYFAVRSRK